MKPTSFLDSNKRRSPLTEIQGMKPGKKKKGIAGLAMSLPLTSLIDAFSIIVIYLLIGTQNSGLDSDVPAKMNLPMAEHGVSLDKEIPVISIEKGVYKINDKVVSIRQLPQKLAELKAELTKNKKADTVELLVQADQEMRYQDLDPLLKASSLSGFEKMKFAVVPRQ